MQINLDKQDLTNLTEALRKAGVINTREIKEIRRMRLTGEAAQRELAEMTRLELDWESLNKRLSAHLRGLEQGAGYVAPTRDNW